MTLDFRLINKATQHSINQIESVASNALPLYLLDNFLHKDLLSKLQKYVKEEKLNWLEEEHSEQRRARIHWVPDSVIEEAHCVMQNLTDLLNLLYNRNNKFHGITIWRDFQDYFIDKHTDNPIIDLAIQIYLTGGLPGLGTKFIYQGTEIAANYTENSGYLMDNTSKISHYLNTPVPADHVRYSCYAIWTDAKTSINTTNSG